MKNIETLVAGNKLTDGKNVYALEGVVVINTRTNKRSTFNKDTLDSKEFSVYQPTEAELEVEKLQKLIVKQRETIIKLKGGKVPGKTAKSSKKETPSTSKVQKRKRIKFTAAQDAKFAKLVDSGMNTKDLAKEFKVPYYAAYHKRIAHLKTKGEAETATQAPKAAKEVKTPKDKVESASA